jgi:nitroreductase
VEVFECIKGRRTVREFKSDPVPERVVKKILQAARWAPSSSNSQPWHFIVIQDRQMLARLGEVATQGPFIASAPMAIAIVMEDAFRPQLDAGRAIQQMELVAWSEGLGTCFVGFKAKDQADRVKELLNVPAELELVTVMPFGYREERRAHAGTPRKPITEIAHRESYGISYVDA